MSKFKVGGNVRIKDDLVVDNMYGVAAFVSEMEAYKGKQAMVIRFMGTKYSLDIDNGDWVWTDEMLESVEEPPQKLDTLSDIFITIKKIINDLDFSFAIYSDNSVAFYIYEVEIPIVINVKSNTVYLDCSIYDNEITVDMMNELSNIMKLLEDNIEVFKKITNN